MENLSISVTLDSALRPILYSDILGFILCLYYKIEIPPEPPLNIKFFSKFWSFLNVLDLSNGNFTADHELLNF